MKLCTFDTNFCRVFRLPAIYPEGYCFGGGSPILFVMVDWFKPIPNEDIEDNKLKSWKEYEESLKDHLRGKPYMYQGYKYLCMTDFNRSFIFGTDF